MKSFKLIIFIWAITLSACAQKAPKTEVKDSSINKVTTNITTKTNPMNWNKLTPEEERVIVDKGTEYPGTGDLLKVTEKGTYVCKRCDAPLYRSDSKFDGHCGWPSFDDEIDGAVTRVPDADGMRTEIICSNCKAHLGHVFLGEGFTKKDTRHCVNSISMKFVPDAKN